MNKQGFVYIWYDRVYKRFYIGCHWGTEDDGYVCSSSCMSRAYKKRPQDFKRRILVRNIPTRQQTFEEEYNFLRRIKPEEVKTRYYNWHIEKKTHWSATPEAKTIAQKSGQTRRGKSLGPCSQEKAAKISAAKKGKALTEEHKESLKAARIGLHLSDDHKAAISASHKSKKEGYVHHTKLPGWVPKPKKVGSCVTCGSPTPSRRAKFCIDHFTTKPK